MTGGRRVVAEQVQERRHCRRQASDSAMGEWRDPNEVSWRQSCFDSHREPADGGGVLAKTCFGEARCCRDEECGERHSCQPELYLTECRRSEVKDDGRLDGDGVGSQQTKNSLVSLDQVESMLKLKVLDGKLGGVGSDRLRDCLRSKKLGDDVDVDVGIALGCM